MHYGNGAEALPRAKEDLSRGLPDYGKNGNDGPEFAKGRLSHKEFKMLPNDYHPSNRCSCPDCLARFADATPLRPSRGTGSGYGVRRDKTFVQLGHVTNSASLVKDTTPGPIQPQRKAGGANSLHPGGGSTDM